VFPTGVSFCHIHQGRVGRKGRMIRGKDSFPYVLYVSFLFLNRACKIEWTEVKKNKKVQQKKLRACVSLFRARSHSLSRSANGSVLGRARRKAPTYFVPSSSGRADAWAPKAMTM
jgi:hypothetical protein